MTPHPQQEYIVDILKVDTCIEKYVEDFATFSKREKIETVKEIHDIIVSCSRKSPTPAAPIPNDIANTDVPGILKQAFADRDATIRNQTLDDFDKEIMKKEEWTRMELLAIIAQKKSGSSVETPTSEINVNDLEEKDKPGCFGAIGLGQHQEYRNCRKPRGCQWEPRCRQSQEDY